MYSNTRVLSKQQHTPGTLTLALFLLQGCQFATQAPAPVEIYAPGSSPDHPYEARPPHSQPTALSSPRGETAQGKKDTHASRTPTFFQKPDSVKSAPIKRESIKTKPAEPDPISLIKNTNEDGPPPLEQREELPKKKSMSMPKTQSETPEELRFTWPLLGQINTEFGPVPDGHGMRHNGMYIAARKGTPVRATEAGTIVFAEKGNHANMVSIQHNDHWMSTYGLLQKIIVEQGTRVKKGQIIGYSGCVDCHKGNHPQLYFELQHHGKFVNPKPHLYPS